MHPALSAPEGMELSGLLACTIRQLSVRFNNLFLRARITRIIQNRTRASSPQVSPELVLPFFHGCADGLLNFQVGDSIDAIKLMGVDPNGDAMGGCFDQFQSALE